MNLFALTSLAVAICCFGLAIFTFKIAKTKLHKIWGIFHVVVTAWGFNIFLAGMSTIPEKALIFWRLAYLPCTFISVVFYHVVVEFCRIRRPRMLFFTYIQGSLFIPLIIFSNNFVGSTFYVFDSIHYHKATFLFAFWLLLWFIITGSAFFELYRFIQTSRGIQKTQAIYLFWGMLLGHTGGAITVIPSFNLPIYPAWHFLICIYAVLSTYAILKHQLMDIRIVIKKGIVYSISIAAISILYLLSIFTLEKLAQEIFGYHSLAISIGTAFALGLLFIPLRQKIQYFMDKYFFKGSAQEISEQNTLLRQEITKSEKHKAVANLASGIAHEIKNPLTTLKTFFGYYPEKKDDPEYIAKFNHIAGREFDRMEGLVQELLDFAKPSPACFQKTDIHQLIEDTLNLLGNKFTKNRITVHKDLASSIRHLNIDQGKIKQALLNIFLNAIDAMPTGGTLAVSSFVLRTSYFVITIEDTGPGINKQDLKHIFEPFYSKKDFGTGLGLAITQGIVQEHGGKISAESKTGKGTQFSIRLPVRS